MEDKRAFPLPTISEDTLHYSLHLITSDPTAQATLITTHVEAQLPHPWLWNKDPWELKVDSGENSVSQESSEAVLSGTMRVGDAVDDEWLVVWLLRGVSRQWKEAVISIRDTDGEFMLIEAAHVLPSWVTPENSENRLWLFDGHLHLLPLSVRSDASKRPKQVADDDYDAQGHAVDLDAWVSVDDAITAVRTGRYRAPAEVEGAIWERISCYPAALATHQHRAKAYLPVDIARALSQDPELIQRAVEGFYVRDPAQLRAAARMTHFPPAPAVLAPVVMTRAAYAQLQGQVFHPPRVFGVEWHVREDQDNGNERKYRDLGVKISTGFEIMYREGGRKGRVADGGVNVAELRREPKYQKYIKDLEGAGFFEGEMDGSKRWQEREEQAAKGWIAATSEDTTQQRPSFAYLVDRAVEESKIKAADVGSLAAGPNAPEDSDEWLEVDPDELDAMLLRSAGGRQATAGGPMQMTEEHGKALQDLAAKVQDFVGGEGDMEGARFADELSDEEMDSDSDSGDEEVTPAQREEAMRKLVPALPEGEWGSATRTAVPEPEKKGGVAATAYGDSLLPATMRPPLFEKMKYDGVESDSESDDELPPEGTLGRHIAQMRWGDGATTKDARIEELSDEEEGDEEDKQDRARAKALKLGDDIDDEMQQRVWGGESKRGTKALKEEEDVDMTNEQDEFLKFSREALGIDDAMWDKILESRRERGAFVPSKGKSAAAGAATQKAPEVPDNDEDEPMDVEKTPNAALNSFESMMAAMDAELARAKTEKTKSEPTKVQFTKPSSSTSQPSTKTASKGKGKSKSKPKITPMSLPTEEEFDAMDDDAIAAMDAELRQALIDAGEDPDADDDIPEVGELNEDQKREYAMMKHLLESYKSQDGGAGVVGNLFGRLGKE